MPSPYNIDNTLAVNDPGQIAWGISVANAVNDLDVRVTKVAPPSGNSVPLVYAATRGNNALSTGWVNSFPVHFPVTVTITDLTSELISGAAGASAIFGLYSAVTPGGQGTLLHTFGTVDCSTNGVKTLTGSWAVPAGVYYIAILPLVGAPAWHTGGTLDGGYVHPLMLMPGSTRLGGRWIHDSGSSSLPTLTGGLNITGVGTDVFPYMTMKVA